MYSIILVALDGSQTASHALDAALELAADAHARLVPVYVVDMPVFAFDTPGYASSTRFARKAGACSTTRRPG
ncbi:universal stress protein [Burkholderia pseudomallei]|nr:universal stress protein [Burkholderia pseudomallei]